MKINTLYLHIGLPKTGSSALQQFFYDNRKKLMDNGLFYPLTGLDGWAHHHFPASINGRNFKTNKSLSELLQGITAEPDFNPRYAVLLSSEAFHNLRPGTDIKKLQQALKDCDVKIIVYFRRQDYWIQSAYNQSVKSHRARITDSIEKYIEKKSFDKTLNYPRFLKKWEEAFGFENIIVKVYEKEQMPQGLFQNFLDIFNVPIRNSLLEPKGNVNPSLSPFALNMLRSMNHLPMNSKMHNGFVKLLSTMPSCFFSKNYFSGSSLLSENVRIKLLKQFEESNRIIARKYLNRQDGVLFYEEHHNIDKVE